MDIRKTSNSIRQRIAVAMVTLMGAGVPVVAHAGKLTEWINSLSAGMTSVMQAIVAIVAIVIGGILVAKAIAAFNKNDYKSVGINVAGAIVAFVLSAMLAAGFFSKMGNNIGQTSDVTTLL